MLHCPTAGGTLAGGGMKRIIELKHVGPKEHVRNLLQELIARLEEKLVHIPDDAASIHVVFEENTAHKIYRTSVTCHVPRQIAAAHEERRDAGESIRKAFAEINRQVQKHQAIRHRKRPRPALDRASRGSRDGAIDRSALDEE